MSDIESGPGLFRINNLTKHVSSRSDMWPIKAGYGEDQLCLSGKLVVVTRYWLFISRRVCQFNSTTTIWISRMALKV